MATRTMAKALTLMFLLAVIVIFSSYPQYYTYLPNKGSQLNVGRQSIDPQFARHNSTVKLLCFVLTYPTHLYPNAQAVRDTWARRCDKTLFVSDVQDDTFPAIAVGSAGRDGLWSKSRATFLMLAESYADDYDWFLKADDDTYVIVENLKAMLQPYESNVPVFFGKRFRPIVKQGYMSGGAGYVLNRGALLKLAEGLNTEGTCDPETNTGAEDALVGRCLERMGVRPGISLDSQGRERFHCFDVKAYLPIDAGLPDWYYAYTYHPHRPGLDGIADYPVSFHYVGTPMMYALEFYVYRLGPVGSAAAASDVLLSPPSAINNSVCEGKRIGVTCDRNRTIHVQAASWGNERENRVCRFIKGQQELVNTFNTSCIARDGSILHKLKEMCDHQTLCELSPTRELLGVPPHCPESLPADLSLQLHFQYTCSNS